MLLNNFKFQLSALDYAESQEITPRLVALLEWMEAQPEIRVIVDSLRSTGIGQRFLDESGHLSPPKARTPEDIAAVGLEMIDRCKASAVHLFQVGIASGVRAGSSSSLSDYSTAALQRYVEPLLKYVARKLPDDTRDSVVTAVPVAPVAIQDSLAVFRRDYPFPRKACFIMMQFGKTKAHDAIERGIKDTLSKYGIRGFLARDKEYHDELYSNIQTYLHGCGFGIAVFERIETEDFNPNVSLEVGYMLGTRKLVLLLKDQTLPALQTDLVGRLYKSFDAHDPEMTIRPEVERWLEDKGLLT